MLFKSPYILLLFLLISCSSQATNNDDYFQPENYGSIHLELGIPRDNDTTDDYIIIRPQYALSYNQNLNVANWVAWELNKSWFSDTVSRYKGKFIKDTSLPQCFYRVIHDDYTNSGYDRGHLVMSLQRTNTIENNKSTFILSNVYPQAPDLNQGVWLRFEEYCNSLCLDSNKELFIYAGGIFNSQLFINGKVAIPDSCFKIVVILEAGQSLKDVKVDTRIITVVMPNIQGVFKDPWEKYLTTIRNIEYSTGYDFLNNVNTEIQDIIENR